MDGPTFAALRDDPALAALLGRTDGGLPDYAPPRADADRIFFRGRETYLEIFAPQNRFEEPVGKVGLGLGLDASDHFDAVENPGRVHCGDRARRTPVEYRRSTPPTPWYDAVQCDDSDTSDRWTCRVLKNAQDHPAGRDPASTPTRHAQSARSAAAATSSVRPDDLSRRQPICRSKPRPSPAPAGP